MEEFDYISEFPDCLLTQILLNLPTKDSVKTSVLSKRWRNLWLNVPGLRLRTFDFPVFPYPYEEGFVRVDFIRQNIYKSKTLVSLKLYNVELKNPEFVVSLPCLKILKLENIFHVLLRLRVSSQTLKSLGLYFAINSTGATDISVEIDTPRLNLTAPKYLRNRDIIGDFLTVISSVRHMIICYSTSKMLYSYSKQLGPIPQFHNLYHLQARFSSSSLQLLPTFLESCPNLKNLIMEFPFEPKNIDFHKVPLSV
ncbi:hypothetical protein AXX17_AT5G43170 [Arabidopsis thaliana]|uniref:F-box domain-containing protein n=1 Tax=Arabidopsis thaliana TaxID=3702 RepID=A0A178UNN1_ARATH|nr:hypothetical protein AXX17_AT5G43170 [Arabidopsis thaliana]